MCRIRERDDDDKTDPTRRCDDVAGEEDTHGRLARRADVFAEVVAAEEEEESNVREENQHNK